MSFLSVEPQSKVVLGSHSNSLLAQFDSQLGVIANRYLAFFRERRLIEATYIDSLRKLNRKAKAVDASFDPRAEPTTTRAAWDKVRDSLERAVAEADTQQAFVDMLDNDIIEPLTTLKKTKDETRKRIEEDLKESAAQYAGCAENTISKLQQAYLKKYYPQQYAHSTDIPQRPQDIQTKRFGGKVSVLFRGRREDLREPEPQAAEAEEVSDDACRSVVRQLNTFRSMRAENLGEGYDCLEELVFTPTIKDVLIKYMDGMMSVQFTFRGIFEDSILHAAQHAQNTSDLRASFRRAFAFSIPPPTLYRNNRPGAYSDLIFGIPLVDLTTNEDNVPKVMRMCIEEVEKRGLNTKGIYWVGHPHDAELRRRFESEKSFSFSSTDNIHSVAVLLQRYFWDLPEPIFMLSLQDYKNYRQTRYTESLFSLIQSKLRELHPVHRASLGALLRHLLRVASHSDKNAMTVDALAAKFCYPVLRGNEVLQDGVHVKSLVMEDLIRNAHNLFDERPSPSPPVPSPDLAETSSIHTCGSFLNPDLLRLPEVQAMGPTIRHHPGLVDGNPTSTESRFTPSPGPLLSPLLGLSSSQTLTEGAEMTTQEQAVSEVRGTKAVETLLNVTTFPTPTLRSSDDPPKPIREPAIKYLGFPSFFCYELAN
ncbi:hypothetical protein EDB92DRAFT_2022602 [Lactarius akahatsu]|uniref:Rho-GAP domain-containing protein n=1 Tax=Lactarius akahatsu TaxID=416441 RepID=A0AAD4LE95_9AGAM|nr:hypothetical protein EDB92DRAFT_2022602 [Lactarius akahatsu]